MWNNVNRGVLTVHPVKYCWLVTHETRFISGFPMIFKSIIYVELEL